MTENERKKEIKHWKWTKEANKTLKMSESKKE
jgi:hypothetical protein